MYLRHLVSFHSRLTTRGERERESGRERERGESCRDFLHSSHPGCVCVLARHLIIPCVCSGTACPSLIHTCIYIYMYLYMYRFTHAHVNRALSDKHTHTQPYPLSLDVPVIFQVPVDGCHAPHHVHPRDLDWRTLKKSGTTSTEPVLIRDLKVYI